MNVLLAIKLFALVVDPIETAAGALIPWALGRSKHAERLLSVATAGAAGIFLGVGVCHMAEDAHEYLEDLAHHAHGLPLSLFLMCMGFSLMLLLDRVICPHPHHCCVSSRPPVPRPVNVESPLLADDIGVSSTPGADEAEQEHRHHHDGKSMVDKHGAISFWNSMIKAGVITFGVMLHSSICGLAIGVAREVGSLVATVVACLAHDWSHACGLMVLYSQLGLSKLASYIFFAAFVLVEPLFIGIGIGVTSALSDSGALIASGVLSAISSGVFVYISVFELLHEAFEEPRDRVLKFLLFFFFVCGIATVSTLDSE